MVELTELYLKNLKTIPNFDVGIYNELLVSNLLNQTIIEGDLLLGEGASRQGCPDLTDKNNNNGYEIVQCDLSDDLDSLKIAKILQKNNYSYTASLPEIKHIDPNLNRYDFFVKCDSVISYGPVIKGRSPDYFLPIFHMNFAKKLSKLRNGNYKRSKTISLVVNALHRFKTYADVVKIADAYNKCCGNGAGFDYIYILTPSRLYALKNNRLKSFIINESTFSNCIKLTCDTLELAKRVTLPTNHCEKV